MLENKYALITGASRGLGIEMAIALAESGLTGVTITAAPGSDESQSEIEEELHKARETIKKSGAQVTSVLSDVGNAGDCKGAVDRHMEAFPSLDILINNAGKAGRYAHKGDTGHDISGHDPAGIAEIIETNLCGPYFMLHHAFATYERPSTGPRNKYLQTNRVHASQGMDSLRPDEGRAGGGHHRLGRIVIRYRRYGEHLITRRSGQYKVWDG